MKTILALTVLAFGLPALANVRTFSASQGAVEFVAIGKPSFIKIRGKGTPAQGSLEVDAGKAKGAFEFDLASLATGIETRDDHMKNKYLEIGKYPRARLEIESASVDEGWSINQSKLPERPFQGQLTLHGVTKPASGVFTMNEQHEVDARFKVKLRDYQIEIPSFAGVTVSDEVEIHVTFAKIEEGKKTP